MQTLTGKQRRHLKGLGHHLDPVVQLGQKGVTPGVVGAVDEALGTHELIKIRRSPDCPQDKKEVSAALVDALGCALVGQVGHTILLYRRHPTEPVITLPAGDTSD